MGVPKTVVSINSLIYFDDVSFSHFSKPPYRQRERVCVDEWDGMEWQGMAWDGTGWDGME